MKNNKPTIERVLNLQTGEIIESKIFFMTQDENQIFKLRYINEESIQNRTYLYVCIFCKQPVKISGGGENLKTLYFRHVRDSDDCPIKTNASSFTKEEVQCIIYNGLKEGDLHIRLKNFIGEYLEKDEQILNVDVDKVYKSEAVPKTWRKPDVLATFKDKKVAFEIQLSTTFLTVIVERNAFYKKENIFIIWVFDDFSVESNFQPFTQKDVYHNNSFNVFVLDEQAREESSKRNELVLNCYYKYVDEETGDIDEEWQNDLVTINQLTFDTEKYKVFFYDTDNERKNIRVKITLEYLRSFYKYNQKPSEYGDLDFLVETEEEINFLNQTLISTLSKTELTQKILSRYKYENYSFSKFIFENKIINLDEEVAFKEILKWDDSKDWRLFLKLLFQRGYFPKKEAIENVYIFNNLTEKLDYYNSMT
jgi:competence CoiA-like predicted nuclease